MRLIRFKIRLLMLKVTAYVHTVDAELALNRNDPLFAADSLLRATRCRMEAQRMEFLGHE